jgi:CDP-glucose 4,6-dehydratase
MSFSWQKKNILITGMSGFFAPHIAEKLLDLGANVIGTVHDKKTSYAKISGIEKKIALCQVDINDINRLKEVITNYEIDYIFHCAANSIVRLCANNPIGSFQTNIIGTANLLEAARMSCTVKGIMCMESDKSYGSFDIEDLPYREDQCIKPSNVYEVSKACSGLIAAAYSNNYSLPVFTIRAANLYGPGDANTSRLIPGSIMRLLHGERPVLFKGVSNYIREFLYVEDAAYAVIKLMEKISVTKSQIINLGSSEIHKVKDVINSLCEYINPEIKPIIKDKADLFKEIEKQYVDYSKLKGLVNDYTPIPLNKGLKLTIDWYSKNKDKLIRPS